MSMLCLTGWQQRADALACIAPDALHFDYASYDNAGKMFAALPRAPDLAIGWSLGGQLLVRAVAGGHVRPKKLLLLAPAFQFVADEYFPEAMPATAFEKFRHQYRSDPAKTVRELNTLIALGDREQALVARALFGNKQVWANGEYWLGELGGHSPRSFSFADFPPTAIVQGEMDRIAYPAHAKAYAARIGNASLHLWPGCSHAPHLHDAPALSKMVESYV